MCLEQSLALCLLSLLSLSLILTEDYYLLSTVWDHLLDYFVSNSEVEGISLVHFFWTKEFMYFNINTVRQREAPPILTNRTLGKLAFFHKSGSQVRTWPQCSLHAEDTRSASGFLNPQPSAYSWLLRVLPSF